ncbi:Coiled-coil domain-containing protein 34 [Microtus ochrogaster]|uniref:Coiled-coil domain-containing protein 34 n=1 Tax=Microtus ochrogaster TaxID=79684 RepID=A0A8J6GT86_MICOH|nr:Coiled-coil domain-containing protein 34 [Microtus ochrogaster]
MRAAGPWRAVSPVPRTRFLARCRPGSRPSSSSVADLIADSQDPGLEDVALTVCLSPPLSCSNSTLSLLSPLGHQSFPFGEDDSEGEDEEAVDEDARESEAKVASLEGTTELQGHSSCEAGSQDTQEQKQMQLRESSLTPWEMWFVGKEKEERGRLQQKVLEVKLHNDLVIES